MSDSTNLMLPYLDGAQAQKHVTVNETVRRLDALVLLSVEDKDLTAPPGSPADGARYIPAATATGAWSGKENAVAHYVDGAWEFYTPREGFTAYVRDEDLIYAYTGSAWAKAPLADDSVTFAKMQNIASGKLLGRSTAGAGDIEEIAVGSGLTLSSGTLSASAGSGEANTASNVGAGGVGIFKQKTGVDLEFKKLNAGSSKVTIADDTGNSEVDIDVAPANIAISSLSGAGALAGKNTAATADIDNGAVTYAKIQNVSATDKLLGRAAAGAGDVEEIACTAAGRALLDDASAAAQVTTLGLDNAKIADLCFVIDGGGSAIATGVKGDLEIPFACTINRATLLADQSGSIVIDIWKDGYANYPPTVADTITASAKPTLSGAAKSQDSTLTGWTTSISAGDILRFNVDSAATLTRVTLSLKVTKS